MALAVLRIDIIKAYVDVHVAAQDPGLQARLAADSYDPTKTVPLMKMPATSRVVVALIVVCMVPSGESW